MTVGFYTVFRRDPQHYALAHLLVQSVRAVMPGVGIVQFTDETSPPVRGVDEVRRLPNGKMLERRIEHYAQCEGDWLLLDTDVIVQQDVRDVFDRLFEVALVDRAWSHLPATPELTAEMPYNTGVVFSRSPQFWRAVLATWRGFTADQQADWFSEQRAVAAVAPQFIVEVLPGLIYNYPPASKDDGAPTAAIVHYKGVRKTWMRGRGIAQVAATRPVQASQAVPLNVYIGYDPRQPVAFHVAAHSVQTRASVPVAVTRLQLNQLPVARRGLTEFTYSRFLVPYLSGYQGWSVFLDADTLCLGNVADLLTYVQRQPLTVAIWAVKGPQRFEWASVLVFDNARCQALTPAYVADPNHALFDFGFTPTVGELPSHWNHLVGYDPTPVETPKLVHYTQGVPVWPETADCAYAAEWHREREALLHSVSFTDLMGASVHVARMETVSR